jgi:hypothetical protein
MTTPRSRQFIFLLGIPVILLINELVDGGIIGLWAAAIFIGLTGVGLAFAGKRRK